MACAWEVAVAKPGNVHPGAEFDDVGLDGVDKTGDYGEGDGMPTSGRGTDLPGEPHIDKTAVGIDARTLGSNFSLFKKTLADLDAVCGEFAA